MSKSVVDAVHSAHPELLARNTPDSNARFCALVVEALGPAQPGVAGSAQPGVAGWTLLSKSPGENGVTWSNGVRTSHDAIFRVDAFGRKVEGVDIIGGAHGDHDPPAAKAAYPVWGNIPSHDWRAGNVPVFLKDVPLVGTVPSQPRPVEPPPQPKPVDLQPVLSTIAALTAQVLELKARVTALEQRPAPTPAALRSHDGRFSLEMQGDGNLVIYENGVPIWASGTNR